MIAFAVDLLVVGALLGVSYCVPGFPAWGTVNFGIAFWGLYFGYHTAALINSEIGLGKLVQTIVVVTVARAEPPSVSVSLIRTAVRCAVALSGIALAKTTQFEVVSWLPIAMEAGLIVFHPLRRSLADLVAGTVVVASPPVQPHRAPAAPMFSKSDAEFGSRTENDG